MVARGTRSHWFALLWSTLAGFGVFVLGSLSDFWLLRPGASPSIALIDDALVGIVAGILVFLYERRQIRITAERKQAENAARDSEERFRLAMNNVAEGLYTLDLNGLVAYVNPAAEAMLGWTNNELLDKKMHDVTHYKHPDGTPFPASECPGLQVLQKGIEFREHEDMFIRKDGSFFPVVYSASPLKREGTAIGIVVAFRDDTQHREAERALRESEQRFRVVANAAPVMIWMSGPDSGCTYLNSTWLEFTGRSLVAELGMGWAEGVHPDDLKRGSEIYTKALDRREPYRMEYRLRRHDGEYRWILVQGVPRFNADGSFGGYIGSAIDVTDRKQAEEALSTVNQKLIQAHEEERTRIARELHDEINQRLALLAISLERLQQNPPSSVAPPAFSFRVDDPLDDVAITAFLVSSLIIVSLVSRVRKQAKDALSSVTYRVIEAEEQECRRIASELHEDIGQRLTLLALEIEKLKTDTSDPSVVSSHVGAALEQSLEILTDVQTLAHELYSPRLQYLGIAEVMNSFCSDFCKQNGVTIDFRSDGLPSLVTPDITLCLFRVLQEALHNAVRHSGVRHFDGRLWGTSDEIHLTVSDCGVGFDLEAARNAGGLGLNRMQERLKLVRGTLSIESQPKGGARIHARVPCQSSTRLTIAENKRL